MNTIDPNNSWFLKEKYSIFKSNYTPISDIICTVPLKTCGGEGEGEGEEM